MALLVLYNSPETKNTQSSLTQDKEKQRILTFEKPEGGNV